MVNRTELLEKLDAHLAAVLDPLLKGVERCALVDFPQHGNVGDSAIWLGERAYLARRGIRVTYLCDPRSWRPEALRRRPRDEVVLLSGGGNLGDLYVRHQRLREQVVTAFRDRRVIQLPQTIRFLDGARLEQARRALDGHPDFTLLVRDVESLACARQHFAAPSFLAPDMAFALGRLERTVPADTDVVWLARSDAETSGTSAVSMAGVRVTDWLPEPSVPLAARAFDRLAPLARRAGGAEGILRALADPLARTRVARGTALLSAGRTVVTDRLHGHILSILLGLPHVLLTDRHGKVRGFHEAWTHDLDEVRWADSPDEALALARA